mmetsp:Transcript_30373/g.88278  ORF Transcript_30373/g.88278 Transcript_30373/m.88278 type:complete len:80 (-) Transcript_30373:921-1160(-)
MPSMMTELLNHRVRTGTMLSMRLPYVHLCAIGSKRLKLFQGQAELLKKISDRHVCFGVLVPAGLVAGVCQDAFYMNPKA